MDGSLGNILVVALLLVVVYFWNYFIIPKFIDIALLLNEKRQSKVVTYLREHRPQVTKALQLFYWLGIAVVLIALLFLA